MEYLTERPLLTGRHMPFFDGLSQVETLRVLTRLQQDQLVRRTETLAEASGEELFRLCQRLGLDHAAVVFSLGRDGDDIGRSAIEKLIGKPIYVHRHSYVRRTVAQEREHLARPQASSPTSDMVVLSVVPTNPKKAGTATWSRFQHWVAGRTVGECLAAGLQKADIPWDSDPSRKFVVLGTKAQWEAQQ